MVILSPMKCGICIIIVKVDDDDDDDDDDADADADGLVFPFTDKLENPPTPSASSVLDQPLAGLALTSCL